MDPNASREEKMDALSKAKQHKLDVAIIARETVRMVLEDHFAASRPHIEPLKCPDTMYRASQHYRSNNRI